jgi:hypothetical protein
VPHGVDHDGERAKAVNSIAESVRNGREEKHQDDLGDADRHLCDCNS